MCNNCGITNCGCSKRINKPTTYQIPGLSAYDLWLADGNTGTIDDYLTSIIGADGDQGIQGVQGVAGTPGLPFVWNNYTDLTGAIVTNTGTVTVNNPTTVNINYTISDKTVFMNFKVEAFITAPSPVDSLEIQIDLSAILPTNVNGQHFIPIGIRGIGVNDASFGTNGSLPDAQKIMILNPVIFPTAFAGASILYAGSVIFELV